MQNHLLCRNDFYFFVWFFSFLTFYSARHLLLPIESNFRGCLVRVPLNFMIFSSYADISYFMILVKQVFYFMKHGTFWIRYWEKLYGIFDTKTSKKHINFSFSYLSSHVMQYGGSQYEGANMVLSWIFITEMAIDIPMLIFNLNS